MELKTAIEKRRSIRKFKPSSLPPEMINELLQAARLAPSGTNSQPWRFIAVTSEEMRKKLGACTLNFVGDAPLVMVCCVDLNYTETRAERFSELKEAGALSGTTLEKISPEDYKKNIKSDPAADLAYGNLNAAIAIEHMILRGTDLGLGSCWIFMFSRKKVKALFSLPDNIVVTALVPFGYSDQDPPPRPRLPMENIFLGEF